MLGVILPAGGDIGCQIGQLAAKRIAIQGFDQQPLKFVVVGKERESAGKIGLYLVPQHAERHDDKNDQLARAVWPKGIAIPAGRGGNQLERERPGIGDCVFRRKFEIIQNDLERIIGGISHPEFVGRVQDNDLLAVALFDQARGLRGQLALHVRNNPACANIMG